MLFRGNIYFFEIEIQQKRQVRHDRCDGTCQCPGHTQIARRRHERQQEHQVIQAFHSARVADEHPNDHQLQNHRYRSAPQYCEKRNPPFDQLQDRESEQEGPFPDIVRQKDQRAEHHGQEDVLNPQLEPPAHVPIVSNGIKRGQTHLNLEKISPEPSTLLVCHVARAL